jgi:hypothetical protein
MGVSNERKEYNRSCGIIFSTDLDEIFSMVFNK